MKISRMVVVDSDAERQIKNAILPICKGKVKVAYIVSDDDYRKIAHEFTWNPTKVRKRVLDGFTDLT